MSCEEIQVKWRGITYFFLETGYLKFWHKKNFGYQINVIYLKILKQCICAKISEFLIIRSNFRLIEECDFHTRLNMKVIITISQKNEISLR